MVTDADAGRERALLVEPALAAEAQSSHTGGTDKYAARGSVAGGILPPPLLLPVEEAVGSCREADHAQLEEVTFPLEEDVIDGEDDTSRAPLPLDSGCDAPSTTGPPRCPCCTSVLRRGDSLTPSELAREEASDGDEEDATAEGAAAA